MCGDGRRYGLVVWEGGVKGGTRHRDGAAITVKLLLSECSLRQDSLSSPLPKPPTSCDAFLFLSWLSVFTLVPLQLGLDRLLLVSLSFACATPLPPPCSKRHELQNQLFFLSPHFGVFLFDNDKKKNTKSFGGETETSSRISLNTG